MKILLGLKRRMNLAVLVFFLMAELAAGQTIPYARSFAKPKEQVEQALKDLQAYSGQKLPILEGFVAAGDKPLDRYERGFCQFTVELLPGETGSTVARVSAKITAWYVDRDVTKSGYQVLASNGRLELDLLDLLEEKLNGKASSAAGIKMQTPRPKLDLSGVPGGPRMAASAIPTESTKTPEEVVAQRAQRVAEEKRVQNLSAELQSLKEIQRNQARPQNLVFVQKSGTPVYAKGTETSRVLFQASANDEFEFLDAEGGWIHVGISGDSRGYLRQSAVELPDKIAAKLKTSAARPEEKFTGFRIEREETSTFPGSWTPLSGKIVKIYTVQPVSQNPKESGPAARLNYSFALFQKGSKEAGSTIPAPDGVVVIFDSPDGGMVGATMADIQKAALGSLTRDAFWSRSYLDPPAAFLSGNK